MLTLRLAYWSITNNHRSFISILLYIIFLIILAYNQYVAQALYYKRQLGCHNTTGLLGRVVLSITRQFNLTRAGFETSVYFFMYRPKSIYSTESQNIT